MTNKLKSKKRLNHKKIYSMMDKMYFLTYGEMLNKHFFAIALV